MINDLSKLSKALTESARETDALQMQEYCANIIPICPVCDRGINRIDDTNKTIDRVEYHRACSRFANALETLAAIGNEIGRPTTDYASIDCQLEEQTRKLDNAFKLIGKFFVR